MPPYWKLRDPPCVTLFQMVKITSAAMSVQNGTKSFQPLLKNSSSVSESSKPWLTAGIHIVPHRQLPTSIAAAPRARARPALAAQPAAAPAVGLDSAPRPAAVLRARKDQISDF